MEKKYRNRKPLWLPSLAWFPGLIGWVVFILWLRIHTTVHSASFKLTLELLAFFSLYALFGFFYAHIVELHRQIGELGTLIKDAGQEEGQEKPSELRNA
jgi:hypothetical protein